MVRAGMWENKVLKLDFWAPFLVHFLGEQKMNKVLSDKKRSIPDDLKSKPLLLITAKAQSLVLQSALIFQFPAMW